MVGSQADFQELKHYTFTLSIHANPNYFRRRLNVYSISVVCYLCWRKVPLHMRVAVIRQVLIPKMLYGAELWGTNAKILGKAQNVANEAMRMVVGGSTRDTTIPLAPLYRELGVPPLEATAKGRVARGYAKALTLKTFVQSVADLQGEWAPAARRLVLRDMPAKAMISKRVELRFLGVKTAELI